jgi:hypothetical protein
MKIRNYQAERVMEVVSKIENDTALTKRLSLKIMNLKEALTKPLENYYKIKNPIIVKYGTVEDNKYVIDTKSERFIEFNKELEPIASDIIEVSFAMITVDEIPDDVKINAFDLKLLSLLQKEIEELNTKYEELKTDSPEIKVEKA